MKTSYLTTIILLCALGMQAQAIRLIPKTTHGTKTGFEISIRIDTVQQLNQSQGIAFALDISNPFDKDADLENPMYDPASTMQMSLVDHTSGKKWRLDRLRRSAFYQQMLPFGTELPRPFEVDSVFHEDSVKLDKRKMKRSKNASDLYLQPGEKITTFVHVTDYPVSWRPPKTKKIAKGIYTLIIHFFIALGNSKYAFYHELKIPVHLE